MAMRWFRNVWANAKQLTDAGVLDGADSGAPTNGTSGTGAGQAGPGSSYTDTATGIRYVNTGTKASPIWSTFGGPIAAAALGGLGTVGLAKMTYSFTVNGGAQSAIVPANSPTLPNKAIILGGTIDITTTLTSGGSATIALGTTAGSSATSLKGATAVATWAAGQLAMVPVFTAATYVKLTAAGQLNLTIATADLTAGVFDVQVLYLIGN